MNCDGQTNSAASHKNSQLTSEVKLQWKAPLFTSGPNKNVEFKFSVVKDYSTYWVKESGTNTVTIELEGTSEPEGTTEPEGTSEPEGEPEEGSDSNKELHESYEGCYESKGCFGVPSGCVEKGTCTMMASYAYDSTDKQFKFDLHLKNVDPNKYVALGKFRI